MGMSHDKPGTGKRLSTLRLMLAERFHHLGAHLDGSRDTVEVVMSRDAAVGVLDIVAPASSWDRGGDARGAGERGADESWAHIGSRGFRRARNSNPAKTFFVVV